MNAVTTVNDRVPIQPALEPSPESIELPREEEAALTFDTVHIRAETVTSVLENILRSEFVTPHAPK